MNFIEFWSSPCDHNPLRDAFACFWEVIPSWPQPDYDYCLLPMDLWCSICKNRTLKYCKQFCSMGFWKEKKWVIDQIPGFLPNTPKSFYTVLFICYTDLSIHIFNDCPLSFFCYWIFFLINQHLNTCEDDIIGISCLAGKDKRMTALTVCHSSFHTLVGRYLCA